MGLAVISCLFGKVIIHIHKTFVSYTTICMHCAQGDTRYSFVCPRAAYRRRKCQELYYNYNSILLYEYQHSILVTGFQRTYRRQLLCNCCSNIDIYLRNVLKFNTLAPTASFHHYTLYTIHYTPYRAALMNNDYQVLCLPSDNV